jgi:hypothetical protein
MFNLLRSIFSKRERIENRKEVVARYRRALSPLDDLTWKCEICGKTRPNKKISVIPYFLDEKLNITRNLKYCNDNLICIHQALVKADSKRM